MPSAAMPDGTKTAMNTNEADSQERPTLSGEMASAVNMMAHPMAGAAAFGVLGMGIASHAVGFWIGSALGVSEAARRMLDASAGEAAAVTKPVTLRLVSSSVPAVQPKPKVATPVKRVAARPAKAVAAKAVVRPAAVEKPALPDDLKAIGGVGPKLEKVLNGLGIWTYGQIAALTETEIAWLDDHLGFSGRIGRDDWVGQARALASGK